MISLMNFMERSFSLSFLYAPDTTKSEWKWQEGLSLVFNSKQLCDHNLGKPTYEKEMMVILHTMETWHPYLIGRRFQIKTNHHSLKYLHEQHFSSPEQHKWVTKMLGHEYEIIYKKGKENVVVDSLSRKFEEDGSLLVLSFKTRMAWGMARK